MQQLPPWHLQLRAVPALLGGTPTGLLLKSAAIGCGELCACVTHMAPKRFVYVIRSDCDRRRYYVGLTSDLQSRLASHNAGESPHTRRFTPWQIVVAIAFSGERQAAAFERFLKSGSGAAFLKQHLLPPDRE